MPFGPEVGTVCGKAARTELCGGRPAMGVPTATEARVPGFHSTSRCPRVTDSCVFCYIVARTAPVSLVYEDTVCMAFMDIYPINTGHVLVIPKRHFVTLDDCDETVARHLISTLRMVNRAVQAATDCGGILNEIMNGE